MTQSPPVALEAPAREPVYSLVVTGITWDRVNVTIRVALAKADAAAAHDASDVVFELVEGNRAFPAPVVDEGGAVYAIQVNVTCFAGRRGIPNGSWRIRARVGDEESSVASYDGSALGLLDEASRVFLHNQNRSVLTVSFGIADNHDRLDFIMRTYQLARNPAPAKRERIDKRLRRRLVGRAAKERYAGWIYGSIARLIGPRPGRILFASDQRPALEGNLLRIQERMIERGLDSQFDMRYSFRLPKTTGWLTSVHILYLMATSEIVLLDDYFGLLRSVRLDPRSRIIQLWHAGSGFKSVGYSRFGNIGSPTLWHSHRQYTYAITGSQHLVPVYAEAFGIEESAVIPTGLPRVDWFLDEERTRTFIDGFYAEHPHLRGKRIILFAPTFRGSSIYKAFYDYDTIDFDALHDVCGPDTVVLFRMHHFVKQPIPIPAQYADRFFDFTHYPDGLGLLHVTDLLITDYSSIIYEYSLLDRPMLFFSPDKVNYAATRGFHRDYDETAPGRVCVTFGEVVDAIASGDYEQWKVARFREENVDRVDTGSADRVIDWLILTDPRTASTEFSGPRGRRLSRVENAVEDPGLNEEDEEA